jgi:tetratricopeptide (TPR) repeat protein
MAVTGQSTGPTGTLAVALAHCARLLESDPAKAAEQARAILEAVPGHPQARLLLGAAQRRQGDLAAAYTLEALAREQPKAASVWLELGLLRGARGETNDAIAALRHAAQLNPEIGEVWSALAEHHALLGDDTAAADARARQIRAATKNPRLLEAAASLIAGKLAVAEKLLRDFLKSDPDEIAALRMLAEVGARLGRYGDAETLLARALELAPSFATARHNYAVVLHRQNKSEEAIAQIEILQKAEPGNPAYRALKGAAYGQIGEYAKAIEAYEDVLKAFPQQPKAWMSYGHALKAVGRQADAVAAYRKSIALAPALGEAWWSLANLKTVRFSQDDISLMATGLARSDIGEEDRYHLHFSLGKALEDGARYAESFEHYAQGNALRRKSVQYDAAETTDHVSRSKALFTHEFFATRAGQGHPAPDPIFIVGLPRAGSTLIEQILATHSQVEGTMELPDIIAIARRLSGRKARSQTSAYPEILATLSTDELHALGQEYLNRTRVQRKLGRPFFIDKMPNNWAHAGLILLILPNARIIDARRHPLGCCFSAYKQHFARGQGFSYDLGELGRYYADYVDLMAHMDRVLPGRIHRVFYERMVGDPEDEVRRLLDYCGLPFEPECLRFYENDRAVRTASSEQVRQPIFRGGVDQWQHYEPWLGPLKATLGQVLQDYTSFAAI